MIETYESALAVDLCEWTFDILLETPEGLLSNHRLKIPPADVLRDLAAGQKRLRLTLGRDTVTIPEELFETLLSEITICQNLLRRRDADCS